MPQLALSLVRARAEVVDDAIKALFSSVSHLYEGLFDATSPQASAQVIQGHDHTPQRGGAPLTRGLVWSENGGDAALYEWTFTLAQQSITLTNDAAVFPSTKRSQGGVWRSYISPGFTTLGRLTGGICYEAQNSEFTLRMTPDGDLIDLPATPAERPQWIEISARMRPESWQRFDPVIQCADFDAENPPEIKIYAIDLSEESGARVGIPGVPLRAAGPLRC